MTKPINKSMDRGDLLTEDGRRFVQDMSKLSETLRERKLPVTSWYGGLPETVQGISMKRLKTMVKRAIGKSSATAVIGEENRGGPDYEPVPGIARDDRHPWFLYWEAYWVMKNGPQIKQTDRVLDAGGTASLFSCYLASRGCEVHSVDLNEDLVAAGNHISRAMGWKLQSHCMNMADLKFPDNHFDHAYSICVFEHLTSDLRQRALAEIARTLKPGGTLSITFDYRGDGVALAGQGVDFNPENLIQSPEDIQRHFLSCEHFEVAGNPEFVDNGKSYLTWPGGSGNQYTFGAIFLRKPK